MEDRTFELLEKLYLDMQYMKTEMKEMKEAMVVKDDLKNFATKDDLKKLATKDDLELISKQLHMGI